MFLFLIPPTIRQQFNTCLACFNDLLVIMLRFGVGIIALCCYLYAFGICCFGIISDPLRGSTSYLFLSPSCAQSLCDFRLHGVSHDAASPMPMASNFCVVGTCRIFLHRLAKVYAYSPKFALNHYCLTIFLAAKRHIKIVPNVTSKLCQMPHL